MTDKVPATLCETYSVMNSLAVREEVCAFGSVQILNATGAFAGSRSGVQAAIEDHRGFEISATVLETRSALSLSAKSA